MPDTKKDEQPRGMRIVELAGVSEWVRKLGKTGQIGLEMKEKSQGEMGYWMVKVESISGILHRRIHEHALVQGRIVGYVGSKSHKEKPTKCTFALKNLNETNKNLF